jgi:Glycosyltransferase family 9 (heptosyltransferase)
MSGSTINSAPANPVEQALARAQAAAQAKRFGESSGICSDLLATQPDLAPALALSGMVAAHSGDIERAIGLLERAVGRQAGVAAWYGNLCTLYRLVYRLQDALNAGTQAVRLAPNNSDYLVNLSLVFTDLDERDRAIACLLRAIGVNAEHADAHLALAQNLLAQGEFEPGWLEYEWRNLTEAGRGQLPKITSAPWNGMRIPSGRILLVGDQGYGDTIQFCRYIPMVAERCHEVILGCSVEMLPLLKRIPGVVHAQHRWNEIPGHAAYCRLSSLPGLFHTTQNTIPADIPYLVPDPARVAAWADRLSAQLPSGVKRVGLAWTGRPTHPNDRRRSVPLSRLAPLAAVHGHAFVSLQKPFPSADADAARQFPSLVDMSSVLTDFDETAAIIANLDLVVTVDTSMGHLAGALGKPVWILLSKASDWRWLIDREDTPWYPTARLFRQPQPGAWAPVIDAVAAALSAARKPESSDIAAE